MPIESSESAKPKDSRELKRKRDDLQVPEMTTSVLKNFAPKTRPTNKEQNTREPTTNVAEKVRAISQPEVVAQVTQSTLSHIPVHQNAANFLPITSKKQIMKPVKFHHVQVSGSKQASPRVFSPLAGSTIRLESGQTIKLMAGQAVKLPSGRIIKAQDEVQRASSFKRPHE